MAPVIRALLVKGLGGQSLVPALTRIDSGVYPNEFNWALGVFTSAANSFGSLPKFIYPGVGAIYLAVGPIWVGTQIHLPKSRANSPSTRI